MADGDEPEGGAERTYDVVTRPGERVGAGSYSLPLHDVANQELTTPAPRGQTAIAVLDPLDRAATMGNRATAAAGGEIGWRAAASAAATRLISAVLPGEDRGRSIVGFDDIEFSESQAFDERQLMAYNLAAGTQATKALVDDFALSVEDEAWEVSDEPEDAVDVQVAVIHGRRVAAVQATKRALAKILDDREKFLEGFRKAAENKVCEQLDASTARVEQELMRYGVVTTTQTVGAGFFNVSVKTHSITPSEEVTALAEAAGMLAEQRKRINALEAERQSALKPDPELEPGAGAGSYAVSEQGRAEYERLTTEIDLAETAFKVLREDEIEEFPVLAAFTDDLDALEELADGATGDNAVQIAEKSEQVLANIEKVRKELGGDYSIWKQPKILDETKAEMADTQWKSNWVDEKSAEVRGEESHRSLLLAVLAIGLGLLAAIPTGGSSLVAAGAFVAGAGAAAISTYTVYEHVSEYRLESAASGTDYDKARAISEEEPSLFWLALDVVGAAIDLAAAAKAFRAAATLRRSALAADALDEATLATVRRKGNEIGAGLAKPLPGLGEKLAEDVAKQRKTFEEAFDEAAKEANAAAEGKKATQRAGRLTRAARRVRQVVADLIERVKALAAKVWKGFGFKYFTVEVKGEWLEIISHSSPGILLARVTFGAIEEIIDNETEALARLQHSGVSGLGKMATADEELAKVLLGNASKRRIEPINWEKIGAEVEDPQVLNASNFSKVSLKPDQDALYILRDSEGAVLKVGKTSDAGAIGRFSVYKRAGKLTEKELQLEVYPLKAGDRTAESYEKALRAEMEHQGHHLPWDNTNRRLGRPGFGTPGEGLRASPLSTGEMTELLEFYGGNLREAAKELGVHRRTVALWANSLGLNPGSFKVK